MKSRKLLKQKNKILPYSRQSIDNNDIKSVINVLKSDYLTQGKQVPKFESHLTTFTKAKFAVAVNSATSALHIACIAIGIKKNDRVWTTNTSFVASANCAAYCDAKIDFLDIELDTYNINLGLLEKKLKATKKKFLPKVIIVVHMGGQPADMLKLFRLSKKYKFKIIEDASHALGSSIGSERIGSCRYSDICVFSFHPVKPITSGEGGAALTNNKNFFEKMSILRNHGIEKNKKNLKNKSRGGYYYEQHLLGYNYRMSDIHAALGISQLKKIRFFIKERNKIANLYYKILQDLPINLPKKISKSTSSYHLFIIRLKSYNEKIYKKIFSFLRSKKIFINLHYLPINQQPFYKKYIRKHGKLSNSIIYSKSAFSIPIYNRLKISEVYFVKKTLQKAIQKFSK